MANTLEDNLITDMFRDLDKLKAEGKASSEPGSEYMAKLYQLKDATTNRLVFRNIGALLVVFALAITAHAQEQPTKPHAFFDRTNLTLFSADALVRSLDAESTRAFMTNPCRCFHEDNLGAIASSGPKMYGYSFAITGAMVGLAYVAHRTGHHRIERLIPAADAAFDSRYVVQNWRLTPPR